VALVVIVAIVVWIVTRRNESHVPEEIEDPGFGRMLE